MNTASIFSFISELQTLDHSELGGREYHRYLNDLELGFKACLFQCAAENREFSDITAIVSNELYESYKLNLGRERMITAFPTKGEDSKATIDLLRLVQKKSLDASRYVDAAYKTKKSERSYSARQVVLKKKEATVKPVEKANEKKPNKAKASTPAVISGTQAFADYLGCSKSTAFKIIKSGVLDGKTQYLTKGVWKFNVARLDKAIQENPKIFK